MSDSLSTLLHDSDPAKRKQAIMRLARSSDPRALQILKRVQAGDASSEIRKLAAQAIAFIRQQQTIAEPAPQPVKPALSPDDVLHALELDVPTDAAMIAPLPPLKRRSSSKESASEPVPRAHARNLMLFALFCVVIGVGVIYVTLGDFLRKALYAQNLAARIENAEMFPYGAAPVGISLDGNLYRGRISDQMTYVVQEPSGIAPSTGWPLIVAVHGSGGTARDGLAWIGYEGQQAAAIVVAPTFAQNIGGNFEYDASAQSMNVLLTELERYYPIDQNAKIIFGFSAGGMFASLYTAEFRYFTGASIGGSPFFTEPSASNPIRFIVVCGESDNRLPASRGFSSAMAARGTPVWYYEVVKGAGHTVTSVQIDKTVELLEMLHEM